MSQQAQIDELRQDIQKLVRLTRAMFASNFATDKTFETQAHLSLMEGKYCASDKESAEP